MKSIIFQAAFEEGYQMAKNHILRGKKRVTLKMQEKENKEQSK